MTTQDPSGTHANLADSGDNSNSQELPRGSNLGRYVIIEPIGSGGMGTVYRAYDPQLNRGIALKILSVKHTDLQAAEKAKARLIREAQALAQLSHPNVVAVHDAGAFEDDVFIAMELVEGKTLDEWMRQKKRSVKEILEVMIAAGRGLSAAHKAGLIHRDFKPGNVIVGDDGRVRVLDFGLARAADQAEVIEEGSDVSESNEQLGTSKNPIDWKEISSDSSPNLLQSPLTNVGGVLGTPLYMAPEQHLGLRTDERTDQFGFCVVLYEALYGKRPFSGRSIAELKREVIRQQVRIPGADTDVPAWLWKIVRKGLSVKPEDRYATIDSLLEDLCKDPEEVRLQKLQARRRKLILIFLVLLTMSLPIGVWYGLRYRTFQLCKNAEDEFVGVWDDTTKTSLRKAFLDTTKSYALGTWERVDGIFDQYLVDWMRMRSDVCEKRITRGTQSEELFDLRMGCLKKRKQELAALVKVFVKADAEIVQNAVQASNSLTGITICANGEALRAPYPPPKTEEARKKVTAIRKKLVEVEAFSNTGKHDEGLVLIKTLNEEANAVDYKPIVAEVSFWFGELLFDTGKYLVAERYLNKAASAAGESKDALLTSKTLASLVKVVGYGQARNKEGLSLGRAAELMLSVAGGDDRIQSSILNNIGVLFKHQGEYHKALAYYQNSLEIRKKALGPKHSALGSSYNNIGIVYRLQGMHDEAIDAFSKALAIRKKTLGDDHPVVADSLHNMGSLYFTMGGYQKAQEYYRKGLEIREKALGPKHPYVASSLNNLGIVFWEQGNYEEALDFHRKAQAIREQALGPEHPDVAMSLVNLGAVFADRGEFVKSLESNRKALAIWEKALSAEHPRLSWSLSGIGTVLVDKGQPKKAFEPLERVLSICSKKTCNPVPLGSGLFGLARALVATRGDKERAIKLANQALEVYRKTSNRFKKELDEVNTWLQKHRSIEASKKGP